MYSVNLKKKILTKLRVLCGYWLSKRSEEAKNKVNKKLIGCGGKRVENPQENGEKHVSKK